jgi:hypothetical protein
VAGREGRSRRFWFDPRFAIGIALIVVSVAGTAFVVTAADSSVDVLAARGVLVPGETVGSHELVVTRVALEQADSLYLEPADVPDAGVVVTRTVAAGELVPVSAVGSAAGLDSTTLVISVAGRLAQSIVPGTTVDVWAATAGEDGTFGPPVVITPSATVVRIVKPDGLVVDESDGSVELVVPQQTVARLLEAVANDDSLSVVPSSIPAGG